MKRRQQCLAIAAFVVIGMLCTTRIAFGQAGSTGTILGVVTDPSGAAVPAANVVVTNAATNVKVNAQTDQYGNYSISNLIIPGPYQVTVSATGFREVIRGGIGLQLDQRERIDLQLVVGGASETVEVTSAIPTLQTDSAATGHVIDSANIVNLPLLSRVAFDLVALLPGVALQPGSASIISVGDLARFNGGRASGNEIQLDGIVNESAKGGQAVYYPMADALEEFKVLTTSYAAEYGRTNGGVIIATIKSGTNSLHGTMYDFVRNEAFNAKNFFALSTQPKPLFRQNQMGVSAGGPIIRNKLFIFGDWEGIRNLTGNTITTSVPTAAMRAGNFSSGFNPIYDPATTTVDAAGNVARTPFAGGIIPATRFDPAAVAVESYYPLPTGTGISNNYTSSMPGRTRSDQADLRLDYYLSAPLKVMFRDSVYDYYQLATPTYPTNGNISQGPTRKRRQNGGISLIYTISPSVANELRFGYNRDFFRVISYTSGGNYPQMLGIPNVPQTVFPTFVIAGLSNVGDGGNVGTQLRRATYYQLADSLSFTRGRHYFKVGVDLRRSMMSNFQPSMPSGQFSFATNQTGLLNNSKTGVAAASFLLGQGSAAAINLGSYNYLMASVYDTFIQDDFRVSSRLTLNLGLRWEPNINYNEKYNRLTWFDPSVGHLVFAGQGGQRTTNYPNHYPNFSPRVGLSYSIPSLKSVVRAGYGKNYTNTAVASNPGTPLEMAFPYSGASQVPAGVYPTDPVFSLHQFAGFAPAITPAQCQATPATCGNTSALMFYDSKAKMPNLQTWNFTVERELPAGTAVSAAYVGSKGTHLYTGGWSLVQLPPQLLGPPQSFGGLSPQQRSPFPAFSSIQIGTFEGSSTYHSFQTTVQHRLSAGVQFGLAFTWDKCLEDVGGGQNRFNTHGEKSYCQYDPATRLAGSYVYQLPFGPGRKFMKGNGLAPKMLGGWDLSNVITLAGGQPYGITVSSNNAGANYSGPIYPNRVAGNSGDLTRDVRTLSHYFDTSAFTAPPAYAFGNSARYVLRGPGLVDFDLVLAKSFPIRESTSLNFRAEAYNILNTPDFSNPGGSLGTGSFGVISAAANGRIMQLALKLKF